SFGTWTCPLVIYAPYGAYLPGGSLWHSQANEAPLAHYPGINIAIPSNPADAAGLLWTAMHCEDPTFILIPKHLLWAEHESAEPIRAVSLGKARLHRAGSDVTVVAWGNTMEKSIEAVAKLRDRASVELIDLRSIAPWDRETIEESVRKTGRLVVVQEDTENCSVGQMIISHVTGQSEIWDAMMSPPLLVSKGNVMIGYNPIYEYAALPDVDRIVRAIERSVATESRRAPAAVEAAVSAAKPAEKTTAKKESQTTDQTSGRHARPYSGTQKIVVPIMGEGIRSAKVVALLKQPGDAIALDDALCEVETDKAVYPIESSVAGTMREWKTQVDDTVEIGQELGTILTESGEALTDQIEEATEVSAPQHPVVEGERHESAARTPALSATITRKLGRVVPANLQIDARWDMIRQARSAAKKQEGKDAPSPSVMVAWTVVRAMEKHAAFRSLMLDDDRIIGQQDFDLGVAVSLDEDRLATAVITKANALEWPEFVRRYNESVEATRGGRVDAMNAPLVISSLGAFGVRAAAPIVVPPSVGTLFVGSAHHELLPNGKQPETVEVITLSLTFDHRVVNGAGAANFVHDIKKRIEGFAIPEVRLPA
ncbi:MAG: 2-oxo acid dehydrogenase subunit E2, partial [Chthoniobacterales bacterium]